MNKETKHDPYLLDSEGAKQTEQETKMSSQGELCPKRNKSIGEPCAVCDTVSKLYATTNEGDPLRKVASRKGAKVTFFMNVVFPENTDKSYIIAVGKKVGTRILEKNKEGEWLDIAHPKSGKGREMKLKKYKGDMGFNAYDLDVVLDKADWDIPDEVLKNLPNLDQGNLIEILQEKTEEVFKVSDSENMKLDETIKFRICPPWKEARDRGERKIMTPIYYHWGGVTRAEIDGDVEMDMSIPDVVTDQTVVTEEKPPWEDEPKLEIPEEKADEREPCFGMESVYDVGDEECKNCKDFKPCGRTVAKKGVAV